MPKRFGPSDIDKMMQWPETAHSGPGAHVRDAAVAARFPDIRCNPENRSLTKRQLRNHGASYPSWKKKPRRMFDRQCAMTMCVYDKASK